MSKLAELLAQKARLEKQIEAAKTAEQADAINQIVDLAKTHGISHAELKPHSLRHTYATLALLNDGMDVHTLARQMGTSIAMIEKHYSHLTPRLRKDLLAGTRLGMVV